VVGDGRVSTNRLALHLAKAPVVITGWTDFDGRLDYRMGLDRLADRVPDRARRLLADLEIDLEGLSTLRLSGTVDDLTVTVSSQDPDVGAAVDQLLGGHDKQQLKKIGQSLRDRFLR
jgi:AsmA protein